MKFFNKNLVFISIIFFFVFMGYSSSQQYLTNYLNFLGYGGFGFYILICIYIFFMLGNLFYNKISTKIGIKKTMQVGILLYFLFVLSLYFGNPYSIFLFAISLGTGAALLRTGSNVYIVSISSERDVGKNSGIFNTFYAMGITLGSFVLGYLISRINYQYSFLTFSVLPLIGFILSFFIEDIHAVKNNDQEIQKENKKLLYSVKKCTGSGLIMRMSLLWFTTFFIFGLVISFLPIQIKDIFGTKYIGLLSSLFFSFLLLFSFAFGKISDNIGRKKSILICYVVLIFGLLFLFLCINKILFILGICLVAIFYTGMNTLIFSLIGDVASQRNAEHITPFFRMIQNLGAITAILLSKIFFSNIVYVFSLVIVGINFFVLYKLYKWPMGLIKERVDDNFLD